MPAPRRSRAEPADYAEVIDREEKMWGALIKSNFGLKVEN